MADNQLFKSGWVWGRLALAAFGRLMTNNGIAHRKTLAWLGHSSSEMLDLYYHLHYDDSLNAMEALAAGTATYATRALVDSGFEGSLRAVGESTNEKTPQPLELQ